MKKILLSLLILLVLCGCKSAPRPVNPDPVPDPEPTAEALEFKKEYESMNGVVTDHGTYRTVELSEFNVFRKTNINEVVEKVKNKETFYLYVGDEMCPWCRAIIQMASNVAEYTFTDEVLYLEIWDKNHKEILRDKYTLDGSTPVLSSVGVEGYDFLLEAFDSVLSDYTLTDESGNKIAVGEKRIYAPNFFYIENGEVKRFVEGYPDSLDDPYMELSSEMLNEERAIFMDFFGGEPDFQKLNK